MQINNISKLQDDDDFLLSTENDVRSPKILDIPHEHLDFSMRPRGRSNAISSRSGRTDSSRNVLTLKQMDNECKAHLHYMKRLFLLFKNNALSSLEIEEE